MSERRMSRRQFLSAGAAGASSLLLYLGTPGAQRGERGHNSLVVPGFGQARATFASPAVQRFTVPLSKPAVMQPDSSDEATNTDYYTITAKDSTHEILPGLMTPLYTYNGVYPGMTFDIRRNRHVKVTVTNKLSINQPISCHNHGGVTAPQHDGYADNITLNGVKLPTLIQKDKSWTYEYPDEQHACTNWFHDHALHYTAEHVYRGMAAFYLIRDDEEGSFNLPRGDYEIPMVFQDRLFDSSGQLIYANDDHEGVRGDVQLVNGAPWPRLKVAPRKYRFRLLNGSNWRRYDFSFSNGMPWIQIGTEAGFLRAPVNQPMIRMYPAERNDVVVDFRNYAGKTIYLLNRAKEARGTPMERVMAFEVLPGSVSDDSQVPSHLAEYEDLTRSEVVNDPNIIRRTFVFERRKGFYAINGKIWDTRRFDASPRLGTTEIWHLKNPSGGWFHPVHIHLINFQILRRRVDLGPWRAPERWEQRARKDVVALPENTEAEVIIKWDPVEYLNFTGPYMIHCHNTDHEDHDMMTQYNLLPQA
jgi:spore coat protein A, manganese oxidase